MNNIFVLPLPLPDMTFTSELVDSLTTEDQYVIRSSVAQYEEIEQWVNEFGKLTKTQWNDRNSKPEAIKMVCRKTFVCHHSAFMKVDSDKNKKGTSKNADCKAIIDVKIKLTTPDTRKKDPFIKRNLPAVIKISRIHSHALHSAQTFRFLHDKTGLLQNTLEEYFNDSMSAAEAKNYHLSVLKDNDAKEEDFADGTVNPTSTTVNNWYSKWRQLNLGPRTGVGLINICVNFIISTIPVEKSNLFMAHIRTMVRLILFLTVLVSLKIKVFVLII